MLIVKKDINLKNKLLKVSVLFPFSELIESAMYLFRATGDHTYLQLGLDALESIEKIAKTPCGYASVSQSGNEHCQRKT